MASFVCFFLHDREFAAPIEAARETVEVRPVTPVFHTPPSVAGIMNLRGEILCVLDTAVLLGMQAASSTPSTRIVVVRAEDRSAGLLVHALGSIRSIDDDAIGPVPATATSRIASVLSGSAPLSDHPVGIVDVGRLLAVPELAPLTQRATEGGG
jgi:purine-binding chemotaxis protein CheW